eukprot:280376-Chlamydomonas_euryale.AAC.2
MQRIDGCKWRAARTHSTACAASGCKLSTCGVNSSMLAPPPSPPPEPSAVGRAYARASQPRHVAMRTSLDGSQRPNANTRAPLAAPLSGTSNSAPGSAAAVASDAPGGAGSASAAGPPAAGQLVGAANRGRAPTVAAAVAVAVAAAEEQMAAARSAMSSLGGRTTSASSGRRSNGRSGAPGACAADPSV